MNKFFKILPAAAIVVGLAGSAFTDVFKADTKQGKVQQQLHWYNNDGTEYLGLSEEPSTGCTAPGVGCAKGYAEIPDNPQADPADETRAFN